MRLAIDAGDPRSVVTARRALAEEIRRRARNRDDAFAAELLIGEILSAEMDRGRIAIALELEWTNSGPLVHLYDQGNAFGPDPDNHVRRSLIDALKHDITVTTTPQGNHVQVRLRLDVLRDHDTERMSAAVWKIASEVVAQRSRSIAETLEKTHVERGEIELDEGAAS